MAKLGKDEFNKKYSEKISDNDDLLIELMEDISDSVDSESAEIASLKEEISKKDLEINDLKMKYEDLKSKYKERFLSSEDLVEKLEEEKVEELPEESLEEKEVIDVKEI